ncbi:MAG: hypothetical protein U9N82_07955 [Thermodesulfobacteriota bacterium]|nr:hypothetical protein [Thermodesulfobacteriota bacterium]
MYKGYLSGLEEYLKRSYHISIFDQALASGRPWQLHIHDHRIITAVVSENQKFNLKIDSEEAKDEILAKVNIKFLYPKEKAEVVAPLLKTDQKVRAQGLEPILSPGKRHHVKNKTLFPLMKENQVMFFTLLEGEIIRGIIAGFSRYEITLNLKGGIPITILRHSIYDLRDKKGRCFLKSFQETHRDWEKTNLFVSSSFQG